MWLIKGLKETSDNLWNFKFNTYFSIVLDMWLIIYKLHRINVYILYIFYECKFKNDDSKKDIRHLGTEVHAFAYFYLVVQKVTTFTTHLNIIITSSKNVILFCIF